MSKRILLFAMLLMPLLLTGQKATITVEERDILTYPYYDPNPVPMLAERRDEFYPYHSFNGYSVKGQMQKWKVVKLENDYVQVWVMPTDGGKVWGAIEKSTGREFIYRNEVMKYRNISMRGPWTSGGIEFNFGFIGHNPSTCVPVDYKTVENPDGSVSCIVGNYDLPSRTKWYVEVRLPKDKAYFETYAMWSNPTPLPQTYYNWMTAAAVVTDDLEFQYPGSGEIGHGGEYGLWPVNEDGREVSWYKNNNFESSKSYHVVGEYNDFMGGYYHNSKFGYGHWALYDDMPGHKLWLWSLARDGGIWEDLLTDSDGQYMEFQAGRMHNQYGGTSAFKTPISQTPFNPGLTDRWHEIWFPVKEIGGISDVSPSGALHAEVENGKLNIGINSFSFAEGKISVKSGGKVVYTETKKFKPMDVFQTSVGVVNNTDYEITVDGMDLQYGPAFRKVLKRPFVSAMPKDIVTASSLYQEGMELKEERNYLKAEEVLKKCLEKDPLYIDAMAALTELYYRSMRYDSALYFANNALMLDTYHPAANFFAGITYLAKGNTTDALESLGWAARSPEYRSVAYAQMAAIELRLNNKELTEHYANQSLDFERYNFNALQVLAVLYRKEGDKDKAEKIIQTILSVDQLSHFADFEHYLLNPTEDNLSKFRSSITNEMPYQTYLELAMVYYGMGLNDDAFAVLEKSVSNPLIMLWKAYLKQDVPILNEVAAASPAFVFPYRTEDVNALTWTVSRNTSWKFKYYLALNYIAIQRRAEGMKLMRDCGQEPDYAPFYITRAALMTPHDDALELSDLQTAHKLAPNDWRTTVRLINYYNGKKDYKMTLTLATDAYKNEKSNEAISIQYVMALINNGQYAKSLKLLDGMTILPGEGAREGKVIYEQAALLMSMDLMAKKKYADAIKMIDKSKEWPERLGVGKPYVVDTRIQDYLNIYCLEKLNRKSETEALKKSIAGYTGSHRVPSYSNILTINVLNGMGDKTAADELINNMEYSKNPAQKWIIATIKNNQKEITELEKELGTDVNFQIIKKVLEVTK
jgi:tetratricopeptide (TPR) repeat protein